MKKLFAFIFGAFLMLSFASTSLFADAAKGQKYYLKFMKEATGMNGAKFAQLQTQAQWEELFSGNAEKFVEKYGKAYPKLQEIFQDEKFNKFVSHLKDFCVEYAVDSGKVPAC